MTSRRVAGALVALLAVPWAGCGQGVGFAVTSGSVTVLNGPTVDADAAMGATSMNQEPRSMRQTAQPGFWRLSPTRMTMRVTGLSFLPEGFDQPKAQVISVDGDCTATYDRARGSLAELNRCTLSAPVGRFGGVTVLYDNTFDVVIDDDLAGIYSEPSSPGGLTTIRPSGGPAAIKVRDQNGDSDEGAVSVFFDAPVTVDDAHPGRVYVVFDPTHWLTAVLQGDGTFDAPQMGGNPPIIPSFNSFGKGALYSTLSSPMAFAQDQCQVGACRDFLFLYTDDATPVSVTWQLGAPCASNFVVSFNGDGTAVGTYGRLGLDAEGVLAWAVPSGMQGDHPPRIRGYGGIFRMTQAAALGDSSALGYKCTTDVPPPTSGRNYSSGAPDFVPDGTIALTLLAQ